LSHLLLGRISESPRRHTGFSAGPSTVPTAPDEGPENDCGQHAGWSISPPLILHCCLPLSILRHLCSSLTVRHVFDRGKPSFHRVWHSHSNPWTLVPHQQCWNPNWTPTQVQNALGRAWESSLNTLPRQVGPDAVGKSKNPPLTSITVKAACTAVLTQPDDSRTSLHERAVMPEMVNLVWFCFLDLLISLLCICCWKRRIGLLVWAHFPDLPPSVSLSLVPFFCLHSCSFAPLQLPRLVLLFCGQSRSSKCGGELVHGTRMHRQTCCMHSLASQHGHHVALSKQQISAAHLLGK